MKQLVLNSVQYKRNQLFNIMDNLFKSKSKHQKLSDQYKRMMEEYHQLSTVDRRKADEKMTQAKAISDEIDALEESEKNNEKDKK